VAIRSKMSATNELRMPKRMNEIISMSARGRSRDVKTEATHSWPCWRYQCRGGPASTPCRCTKSKTRSKEDPEASSSVPRSRLIANTRSETHPLGLLLLLVSTLSLGGGGLGSLSGSLGSGRGLGGGTGRGRGLRSRSNRKSDDIVRSRQGKDVAGED
jgi:hypothetical protein